MERYSRTWLPCLDFDLDQTAKTPLETAQAELSHALGEPFTVKETMSDRDSYEIQHNGNVWQIVGGACGVLYGAYALLMALKTKTSVPSGLRKPFYPLRMINCWDNADGSVERGYSGRSLFFDGGKLSYDPARIRQLGRMLASVGINAVAINNVNVRYPADQLIDSWLPETAVLAALLRPFGVRLILSIDYSAPLQHGVKTADPLDPDVQNWWNKQTALVYQYIPDLVGFLVKADSESRPGPFTYGRNHAEGANMLARALKPFGGKLIWRCFVYNCQQDWRDTKTDRPMAAYIHYAYLDGQFEDNVILQIKNGPFDFQVREPVSPLLFAMNKTQMALEFQLAQEYTGHQIDLYYMPPMWKEVFDEMPPKRVQAICAVGNLGNDLNYTGHPFAAANLFAFGRSAWNPAEDGEAIARLWCKLTYAFEKNDEDTLTALLMRSREIYEKYTSPLGLCWMVVPNEHYGPSPDGYEYSRWGTFHRADCKGVGIDRTKNGTGYLNQYPDDIRKKYETVDVCPDLYKLFYHRMGYTDLVSDGRTLIQRIYDDHFEGLELTLSMKDALQKLPLPEPDKTEACKRMDMQVSNAREWCDVVNSFFHRLSGIDDEQGRTIYG